VLEKLEAAGVDLSVPLELGLSVDGSIEVRNAHIQALEVEQLLNADAELVTQFQTLLTSLAKSSAASDTAADPTADAAREIEIVVSVHDVDVRRS
jgi:hypothetical protein